MRETIPDRRPKVIELLELLALEDRQLEYSATAPDGDTTSELFTAWCDAYRYGDREFEACFSQAELIALARFSAFYQASRRRLPESRGTVGTLLASPMWREVMLQASIALEKIKHKRK